MSINKQSSFLTDFSLTSVSQVIITVANILIFRILALALTEEGMGIYLIIRRLIAFLFPVITVNLSMSITRYISFDTDKAGKYFVFSFMVFAAGCLLLLALLPFSQEMLADWIFGSPAYAALLYPTLAFLFANCFQLICLSFFRGQQQFTWMNIVDVSFWIAAFFCLGIISWFPGNDQAFLAAYFYLYALLSFAWNVSVFLRRSGLGKKLWWSFAESLKPRFYKEEKRFVLYGASRLPSGFFFGAMFFIPILAATNFMDLKAAAYLGILISVVRMVQLAGMPFNTLFLPKFSAYQAAHSFELIRQRSQSILEFVFTFPLLLGVLCGFFAPEMIELWFGPRYEIVIPLLRFVSPLIGALLAYVVIRGVLDGFSDYPFVNVITFLAVAAVVLISVISVLLGWELWGQAVAFGAGMLTLGLSAIMFLVREQKLTVINARILSALGWAVLVFLVLESYSQTVQVSSVVYSLFWKLLIAAVVMAASGTIYYKLKYPWLRELLIKFKEMRS